MTGGSQFTKFEEKTKVEVHFKLSWLIGAALETTVKC